jgi:hypothetical protein
MGNTSCPSSAKGPVLIADKIQEDIPKIHEDMIRFGKIKKIQEDIIKIQEDMIKMQEDVIRFGRIYYDSG